MNHQATNKILELIEEGLLNRDNVIMACLKFMSEDDVEEMARINELFWNDDDDDDHED